MPDIEKIKREGVAIDVRQLARHSYKTVSPDDHYRLKTQGVCSQRNPSGQATDGRFMLRVKIPFGQVKPSQLFALADLAEKFGRGWGHLTTRQGFELHSTILEDVPVIFEQLEKVGLTTKASCGDTIRNVVTCSHVGEAPPAFDSIRPALNGPLFDVRPWALLIQNHFLELGPDNLNLPRKMNAYLTGCPDCIGHARINDLGLVATTRRKPDGKYEPGFALWVGGGLGANPRLAHQLRAFLSFEEVLPTLEAVVRLYIDHGSRRSRATAKLKFLIEEWGMGRFSNEFEKYYQQIAPQFKYRALPRLPMIQSSRLINIPKSNPNFAGPLAPASDEVEVLVINGEIQATALRNLANLTALYGPGYVYFTKEQNIRFKHLDSMEATRLREALGMAGFEVEGAARIDDVLSCPGTAFCPVGATPSLTMSEQLGQRLRQLIQAGELPAELQNLRIHISGCPHSCAQHQVADLGLAGTRVPDANGQSKPGYQLFLGGKLEGIGKLALLVHHGIPAELVVETVLRVLALYQQGRGTGEDFSQYVYRIGQDEWEERLEQILIDFEADLIPA